jgi:triosephosphate isomerase
MRRKIVAGNWKMHGSLSENQALLSGVAKGAAALGDVDAVVCVPFPYLPQTRELLAGSRVHWGAQDASEHAKGAYTGEVSAAMLAEFACRYAIVGHSERRSYHHEDDALVSRKALAVLGAGITPIVCVGETLEERESGRTEAVVGRQIDAVADALGMERLGRCVVAYEPVWAIGTGRTATPAQAQEVHGFLRGRLAGRDAGVAAGLRLLYGGSVKGSNAAELFGQTDVDGGLVGGASLNADEFLAICRAGNA